MNIHSGFKTGCHGLKDVTLNIQLLFKKQFYAPQIAWWIRVALRSFLPRLRHKHNSACYHEGEQAGDVPLSVNRISERDVSQNGD
jgi:hypothetical protein